MFKEMAYVIDIQNISNEQAIKIEKLLIKKIFVWANRKSNLEYLFKTRPGKVKYLCIRKYNKTIRYSTDALVGDIYVNNKFIIKTLYQLLQT